MRRRICVVCTVFTVLILFMGSCSTKRVAVKYPKSGPVSISERGTTITIEPLDKSQLEEQFGKRSNPFIPPPRALGFNSMRVFRFSIESMNDVLLVLNSIELQFGGKLKSPENAFHLINYWELEGEKADSEQYDIARMRPKIKRNLLPNDLTVEGGSNYSGILVFQGRLPSHGRGTIVVPVFKAKGELIHDFIFEMDM